MVSIYTDNQKPAFSHRSDDTRRPQSPAKAYEEMLDNSCDGLYCDDLDEILDCQDDVESILSEDGDGGEVDGMLLGENGSFWEEDDLALEESKPYAGILEGEPSDLLPNMHEDQTLYSRVCIDDLYVDYPNIRTDFKQFAFLDLFDDIQSDLNSNIRPGDSSGVDRELESMPETHGRHAKVEYADEMLDDEQIHIEKDHDRSDRWKLTEGAFNGVQAVLDEQQQEMLM